MAGPHGTAWLHVWKANDVYSTYEMTSWHSPSGTVDELSSLAYGNGAAWATADITNEPGAPGDTGCRLHRNTS